MPSKYMPQFWVEWMNKEMSNLPKLVSGRGDQVSVTSKSVLSLMTPDESWRRPKFLSWHLSQSTWLIVRTEWSLAWKLHIHPAQKAWIPSKSSMDFSLWTGSVFAMPNRAAGNDYCSCFPLKFHVRLLNRTLLIWRKGVGEEPHL